MRTVQAQPTSRATAQGKHHSFLFTFPLPFPDRPDRSIVLRPKDRRWRWSFYSIARSRFPCFCSHYTDVREARDCPITPLLPVCSASDPPTQVIPRGDASSQFPLTAPTSHNPYSAAYRAIAHQSYQARRTSPRNSATYNHPACRYLFLAHQPIVRALLRAQVPSHRPLAQRSVFRRT